MVGSFFTKSKRIITAPQSSILSAAMVIMMMIVMSQFLGVVRQRVLLHFFTPSEFALFLAAFRLPDLVFEVFAFGAFSSAFIPVFTKTLKKGESEAWDVAGRIINISLVIFAITALVFGLLSTQFYTLVAPGFSQDQIEKVSSIARILFAAQGFFIISYVLTGVLESLRRFLVPALAPIFYNLGIIVGTLIFAPYAGLWAPAIGVVIGALAHLLVQLPLAFKLGFKFSKNIAPNDEVRLIGKLAAPRVVELAVMQIQKTSELLFASLLSVASYTYLNLANSLQIVPISLFGVSLAKAALVTLTHQDDDEEKFKKTFLSTFNQMMFFVVPVATLLIVFRIPIVRLIYGTAIFDWEATVQTGLVLSTFSIGIPFQAALALLSRAFYARHDTKTPVVLSIIDVGLTIVLETIFIFIFHLPVWSIALANTLACILQVTVLFLILGRRLNHGRLFSLAPLCKIVISSAAAGGVMFFLLKLFDRSVWVKRLSFLSGVDAQSSLAFSKFVLDTRYIPNLILLTFIVGLIGMTLYIIINFLLRTQELWILTNVIRKRIIFVPRKEEEPVTNVS